MEYRRSRIPRHERGVAPRERGEEEEEGRLRFDQLGLRASQLKLPYYRRSIAGDEERWAVGVSCFINCLYCDRPNGFCTMLYIVKVRTIQDGSYVSPC